MGSVPRDKFIPVIGKLTGADYLRAVRATSPMSKISDKDFKEWSDQAARMPLDKFLHKFKQDKAYAELAKSAYYDNPMPIGHEQTITQPSVVAFMAQALKLKPGEWVYEIGTGSGYNAAILSRLVGPRGRVITFEIVLELLKWAQSVYRTLKYTNIKTFHGNGMIANKVKRRFDAVVLTACPRSTPRSLFSLLKENGRILYPFATDHIISSQKLVLGIKRHGKVKLQTLNDFTCRFVPIQGKRYGWNQKMEREGFEPPKA